MKKPKEPRVEAKRAQRKAGETPRRRNLTLREINEALVKGSTPKANKALKSRLDQMTLVLDDK